MINFLLFYHQLFIHQKYLSMQKLCWLECALITCKYQISKCIRTVVQKIRYLVQNVIQALTKVQKIMYLLQNVIQTLTSGSPALFWTTTSWRCCIASLTMFSNKAGYQRTGHRNKHRLVLSLWISKFCNKIDWSLLQVELFPLIHHLYPLSKFLLGAVVSHL